MDEQVFFESGDVKVTNARFITGGQTFAMSNVTSVKALEENPSRFGGIVVILIGIATMVSSIAAGLIIAGLAAWYLYQQKTSFHVMLSTSGGERSALTTHQREYLTQIVDALNKAIVHRG